VVKDDAATGKLSEATTGLGDNDIIRGRAGIILPQKNAFDFVERPAANVFANDSKKSDVKGGAANVRKVMEALKKRNRTQYTNKRMQIVKIDA
jgi:hypothetical protein